MTMLLLLLLSVEAVAEGEEYAEPAGVMAALRICCCCCCCGGESMLLLLWWLWLRFVYAIVMKPGLIFRDYFCDVFVAQIKPNQKCTCSSSSSSSSSSIGV